ncbi:DUF4870 domain-containing protein [Alteromonas marina]|nr:DUF4870 domain-containing protein [Alteromonas sp. KUL150]
MRKHCVTLRGFCKTNLNFAIVAAVKANKGELWVYPLSIEFIKR